MINVIYIMKDNNFYVYFSFTTIISSMFKGEIKKSFEDWNYLSHLANSWKNFIIDNNYLGLKQ